MALLSGASAALAGGAASLRCPRACALPGGGARWCRSAGLPPPGPASAAGGPAPSPGPASAWSARPPGPRSARPPPGRLSRPRGPLGRPVLVPPGPASAARSCFRRRWSRLFRCRPGLFTVQLCRERACAWPAPAWAYVFGRARLPPGFALFWLHLRLNPRAAFSGRPSPPPGPCTTVPLVASRGCHSCDRGRSRRLTLRLALVCPGLAPCRLPRPPRPAPARLASRAVASGPAAQFSSLRSSSRRSATSVAVAGAKWSSWSS